MMRKFEVSSRQRQKPHWGHLACIGVASWFAGFACDLRAEDGFAAELPRIPATSPEDALKTFAVANGFEMQLVASEPDVASPVAMEWDADGKLYVCEMRGYSEDRDKGLSRIRCLEDTDQDGFYDKSVIYADGLLWPTGLFPFNGGLFVGDAPNLYYFKDRNGDGLADERQLVLTGFGTSNVQGLMNSFRWGLDNRIHIACSSVGGTVRKVGAGKVDGNATLPAGEETDAGVNVRGRDIAFDPLTGEFELTSGAAQHGMCFDDWGRKFVSSNSNHIQQVMYEERYLGRNPYASVPSARISIAADGPQAEVYRASPVEPWRIVRTRLRVGGLVPGPVEGGGRAAGYFTGATGVTIYRGDGWPKKWKGLAIVGDVGSNLVHRKVLEDNGAEKIARRIDAKSEFITSTDIWFRPAQFANSPDGHLHIIDVCREVIEHPKSLPPEIKQHLDLTSGRDRGRIYRIAAVGSKLRSTPQLSAAPTLSLVKLLDHSNAWHRETAARLIYQRQDRRVIPTLRELVRNGQSPQGRLHALYALDGLEGLNEATVIHALTDKHPQVRRHAVRLAETFHDSVEMFNALEELASDSSIEVRIQLAFTIGQFNDPRRVKVLGELVRQDMEDRWIQAAVHTSLEQGSGELFALLIGDSNYRSSGAARFLERLATQIGQQERSTDIESALASVRGLNANDAPFALPILGPLTAGRSRANSRMHELAKSGELEEIDALIDTMLQSAAVNASNSDSAIDSRVSSIRSLAYAPLDNVRETLVALVSNRQPIEVSKAAIQTLGSFRSDNIAVPLLEAWPGLSPKLRATAAEVLFARPGRTVKLFDAVDSKAIALSDIGTPRLKIASQSRDKAIQARAKQMLSSMGSRDRAEVVRHYREALTLAADANRGRQLFAKHCSVCHKMEGVGHEIGPSLAAIKTRGAESILVNVLDPNREVNPEYLNYVLLTENGRAMTGMISAENATSVTLRRAEAESDTVLRIDIDQLKSTGLSIMPEGLEKNIDRQAMADIIRYLMEVGGGTPAP